MAKFTVSTESLELAGLLTTIINTTESLFDEFYSNGRKSGYDEGHQVGYDEGWEKGKAYTENLYKIRKEKGDKL